MVLHTYIGAGVYYIFNDLLYYIYISIMLELLSPYVYAFLSLSLSSLYWCHTIAT